MIVYINYILSGFNGFFHCNPSNFFLAFLPYIFEK